MAERGVVEEDGRWNVLTFLPTESYVIFIDCKEISKDDIPYIPLSSIKELKYLQGEMPRRIELYTTNVSGFSRENRQEWPDEFKEREKRWMFVRVQDAATGRQLTGATVSIEGTDLKIRTNAEGWCELKVPLGSTLKAEYQGMETKTRHIDSFNGNTVQGYTFSLYQPGTPIYYINELSKDQEPVFPGNQDQWLAKNTQLPKAADGKGQSGYVSVWLVVNEDGSVSGVRLKDGISYQLNTTLPDTCPQDTCHQWKSIAVPVIPLHPLPSGKFGVSLSVLRANGGNTCPSEHGSGICFECDGSASRVEATAAVFSLKEPFRSERWKHHIVICTF